MPQFFVDLFAHRKLYFLAAGKLGLSLYLVSTGQYAESFGWLMAGLATAGVKWSLPMQLPPLNPNLLPFARPPENCRDEG